MFDAAIFCPSCRRRVFTARDIVYAPLDGAARCRVCGGKARLDLFSRWMISCMIALVLPALLLYLDLFYSGHLFLVSIVFIFSAWRVLSFLTFPFLALEVVPSKSGVDRKQSVVIFAILLAAAMMIDGFMASRFEVDHVEGRHVTSNREP
jgi:hypothetical protein